jgi:hypothetical protein
MTTNQHATVTGEAEAPPTACGCRNGDPAATLAIQRKLVERAIERDPVAVGELFDRYAEDVYGYVLAWTRDVEVAEQLTERVFHDVLSWLPVMQQGDGELAAWLIAMARDAVAHGPHARPATIDPTDPAQAVSLLDDPEREVVVFRLLLGHSLLHSAHLAGYRPRVAKALQFIACSTLWRNSVDPAAASAAAAATGEQAATQPRDGATPPPYYLDPKHDRRRADEFELRLNEPWGSNVVKGDDAELDNAMTVASTLRLAAPNVVAPPDPAFLSRVREELMADTGGQASPEPSSPMPTRVARKEGTHSRGGVGLLAVLASTRRLQLVAVLAALVVGVTAAVVVSASLSGPRSKCGSGGCLASATTGTGPSAVLGGTPTPTQALPFVASSSTSAGSASTAATAPPSTRARASATTGAPQTTAKPTTTRRATTTTVKPTTTAPTTTILPTTTTAAPAAPALLDAIVDLLGG